MSQPEQHAQPTNPEPEDIKHEEQKQTGYPEEKEIKAQQTQPINERFISSNIELAQQLKTQGNDLFKSEQFLQAIHKYQQALTNTNHQEKKLRCVLYSNISICLAKEQNFKDALSYCKKAVGCDPTYMKAQLNLATYYEKNDELDEALAQNKKLLESYPNDVKLLLKIKQLQKAIQEKLERQKKEVMDGLKNIGNSVLGYFGLSLDNFKLEQGSNGGYNVSFKQ